MKDADVKIGMKVVPYKKTHGFAGDNRTSSDLANSHVWNYAKGIGQIFLYVIRKESNYWVLSYDKCTMGDFFNASDFKPFHSFHNRNGERMTLQTWKKEFYPVYAAHPMTERQAIKHSLKKWEGLLKKNLKKHHMEDMGGYISDDEGHYFEIDFSTCSLCAKHHSQVGNCFGCSLYKSLGSRECHSWPNLNAPYSAWLFKGDPKPMIRALRKTLKDYDAGRLK